MEPIEAFFPLLNNPARVVITTHQKPDGDAMGSSLAMYHFLSLLGHSCTVISPTNWAGFLNWMPGCEKVVDFETRKTTASSTIAAADYVFCLDFNTLARIKNMEPVLLASQASLILIDHHQQPQAEVFAYGVSDTSKSSTCEMVFDFIVSSGYGSLINEAIAECLYTGVMTDTGSFRFPIVTASVHRMVAHLKDAGLKHHLVHEHIYDNYLENRLRFIGHVLLNRMDVIYELNTVVISVPKSDLARYDIQTGDTEGLVNYPLSIQGIKLAAIVIDRDEERKWSFRSKGKFDVNQFARSHFEGGGHRNAAGGRSGDSLDSTLKKFYEVIKDYAGELGETL
jgi:phosphoesterase RecJ-like protein